jgi:hypothetical protein
MDDYFDGYFSEEMIESQVFRSRINVCKHVGCFFNKAALFTCAAFFVYPRLISLF